MSSRVVLGFVIGWIRVDNVGSGGLQVNQIRVMLFVYNTKNTIMTFTSEPLTLAHYPCVESCVLINGWSTVNYKSKEPTTNPEADLYEVKTMENFDIGFITYGTYIVRSDNETDALEPIVTILESENTRYRILNVSKV